MKLKFLVVVAIIAISFPCLILTVANAQQAPKLTFGDGNYVDPFANVRVWTGVTMKDKYASGTGKADTDSYVGFTGGGTEFGLRMQVGKMYVEGSIATKYAANDDGMSEDTFSTPSVAARYMIAPDFFISWGTGADQFLTYKGDCAPLNTVADDGYRGFAVGGGGTYLGAAYKGAFVAIFNQGYLNDGGAFGSLATSESVTDYLIPRMALGYTTPGPIGIGADVIYQSKKIDDSTSPVDGKTITSYIVGAQFDMHGPLTLHGHAYYHQNATDMGFMGGPGWNAQLNADGDGIANTRGYGGNAAFAYKVGNIEPAAGLAYKTNKTQGASKGDPAWSVFARVGISVEPGFTVYPGIIYTDNMKNSASVKEGATTQFGIFWEEMI